MAYSTTPTRTPHNIQFQYRTPQRATSFYKQDQRSLNPHTPGSFSHSAETFLNLTASQIQASAAQLATSCLPSLYQNLPNRASYAIDSPTPANIAARQSYHNRDSALFSNIVATNNAHPFRHRKPSTHASFDPETGIMISRSPPGGRETSFPFWLGYIIILVFLLSLFSTLSFSTTFLSVISVSSVGLLVFYLGLPAGPLAPTISSIRMARERWMETLGQMKRHFTSWFTEVVWES